LPPQNYQTQKQYERQRPIYDYDEALIAQVGFLHKQFLWVNLMADYKGDP
jgi:hypothetical protein